MRPLRRLDARMVADLLDDGIDFREGDATGRINDGQALEYLCRHIFERIAGQKAESAGE